MGISTWEYICFGHNVTWVEHHNATGLAHEIKQIDAFLYGIDYSRKAVPLQYRRDICPSANTGMHSRHCILHKC